MEKSVAPRADRAQERQSSRNAVVSILLAVFAVFLLSHFILLAVVAGLIGYRVWTDEVHRILWITALLTWLVGGAVLFVMVQASQRYAAAAAAPLLAVVVAWVLVVAVRGTRASARVAPALALALWIPFSLVGVGTLELVVAAGGMQWPATVGLP